MSEAATMTAALAAWCDRLTAGDVTAAGLARELGEVESGTGTPQLAVRPSDPAWARAELVSRPGETAPSLVRLTPAGPAALSVAALDAAFGAPATLPPKVSFTDPVIRIYEIDTGAPSHTAAIVAELPPEGGEYVTAVVLRRDIRL